MDTRHPSENWNVRTVGTCLFASLLFGLLIMIAPRVGMIWMSQDSYVAFRHRAFTKLFSYLGTRLVVLAVCVYCAKVRSWQDFVAGFALLPAAFRLLLLSAMLGVFLAFFLTFMQPGAMGHITFQIYFGVESIVVLTGPFCEEIALRGFFYRACRNVIPGAFSIVLAFGVDALLFHYGTFKNLRALFGVGVVNVIACLLREHTKSTWPSIIFHVAFNLPFAIFASMR
jgi:membrane protease YdiL (CAAX protease family)